MTALALALNLAFIAPAASAGAGEVTVSAAASLTNAFTELKGLFEKQHPGLTVNTNFAASNPLLKQIHEGAPVDVFASADQQTMDKAEESGLLVPGTRVNFALNDLVLIVPKGAAKPADLKGLSAFARIDIGAPESVPAGRYARASLTNAGLWDGLQPRLIPGNSVRQVLDYVSRGEVDAGFVYRTDALLNSGKVDIVLNVEGHDPVSYPIAVVNTGKNASAGREFTAFVLSEAGQAVLAKYGFSRP
ncbi:MAG: molybdate ABC transporter substrate-binding protein [Mailhella sp.]|nr:molybdate ABC transporter substrate-binding protein [Mailhella sp.]